MESVVTKYFYNEIEYLTEKIGELGLTKALVMTAKEQELEKMQKLSEEFFAEYPEVHEKLLELYLDYYDENYPIIFDGPESNSIKKYDKEKIKIIDLVCLCALSEERMSPDSLFLDDDVLQETLCEEGYNQIAKYIQEKDIDTLEALMEAFKKE